MSPNGKKQVPLRLSERLYDEIAAWAEDDFRSINGQIEYLLSECVRQRRKKGFVSPPLSPLPDSDDTEQEAEDKPKDNLSSIES